MCCTINFKDQTTSTIPNYYLKRVNQHKIHVIKVQHSFMSCLLVKPLYCNDANILTFSDIHISLSYFVWLAVAYQVLNRAVGNRFMNHQTVIGSIQINKHWPNTPKSESLDFIPSLTVVKLKHHSDVQGSIIHLNLQPCTMQWFPDGTPHVSSS